MINIVINNREVRIPSRWSEISICQAIELQDYIRDVINVEKYTAKEDAEAPKWLTNDVVGKILGILSCPEEHESKADDIERIDPCNNENVCNLLWQRCLRRFINGLILETDYELKNIRTFNLDGLQLSLPEIDSLKQLSVCQSFNVEQFCMVNDLYAQNPLKNSPLIIAILAKEEGSRIDLSTIYQRAVLMQKLPMSIAFETFALIANIHILLKKLFPSFYKIKHQSNDNAQMIENQDNTWEDLLIYGANEVPSEIALLRKQKIIDFMQLIDFKLKKYKL